MISALQFVQGGVARKDYVPGLTHFRIEGGRIQSFNGTFSLSAPIDLDLEVSPKAEAFQKAVASCGNTPASLSMTAAGRLGIRAGKFRAYVECTSEPFPVYAPTGERVEFGDGEAFLASLDTLAPFMSQDASRAWSQGILLRDRCMWATCNTAIVQKYLGFEFPREINIPRTAVHVLLRIGAPPIGFVFEDNSITFHFESDRWMKTQMYSLAWPDMQSILDRHNYNVPYIPDDFWSQLEQVAPFVDEAQRVYFNEGRMLTSLTDGIGASCDLAEGCTFAGCFNHKLITLLRGVATGMLFGAEETGKGIRVGTFVGDQLRGLIAGTHHAA